MHRLRKMRLLAVSAILLTIAASVSPLATPHVLAQATSGGLRGVVTDPSGAVVPDATITAREVGTGAETTTRSNAEGLYTLPKLKPGKYLLTIEKEGFRRQEFQDVDVILGQDQTIDATLTVGAPTETVTVTATGEELIQRENVQVSQQFQSRQISDLPSNIAGGGIDTLAILAPGVVPSFAGVANNNGQELSVNGNRPRSNNFSIDGQDNNDLTVAGPSFFVDNPDIVAEYQVITNNFSAEYGRNQGAVINIVTKAGTNDFHGTGFWFHRDRKNLDSLTNFERRSGREDPPPFLYNVYGGTLGGPIVRDRAFFFGSYQLITARATGIFESANPTIAPEELSRLGAAFPNNPAIQALANFSAFALTDIGTVTERTDRPTNETITLGGQTFRLAYPVREISQPVNQHEFSIRGDLRITDRHSIWYRHLYQTVDNQNALVSGGSFVGDIPATTQHGGANFTSQISNNAVNEFRFAFTRLDVTFGGGCEGVFRSCIPGTADVGATFPSIAFAGLRGSETATSVQTLGPANTFPQGRTVRVYQFADNVSLTRGRHQFKFGADIRRLTNSSFFLPNISGTFRFNTVASVLENRPTTVLLAAGQPEIEYTETDQFYYFQDDWRVRDNLTLNLGVRYEYFGQPLNVLNEISVERESNADTALFRQDLPLEARTFPRVQADKNNWAPRLGFAWRPRMGDSFWSRALFGTQDQTVISGGYSIAYDPAFYNLLTNIATSSPLVFLNTVNNPATGAVLFPLPSDTTGAGVQQFAAQNNLITRNLFDPRFFAQTTVAPDFYNPYSQQWSLRIQREVGRNNVAEVRYVGTRGVGLFQTVNRNPRLTELINGFTADIITGFDAAGDPITEEFTFRGFPELVPGGVQTQVAGQGQCVDDPRTTTLNEAAQCAGRLLPQALIRSRENTASSIYHALQTRFAGRLSDIAYGVSYTLSKTIDNASEVFSLFESAAPPNPFDVNGLERGLSLYDRRHALAVNWVWDFPLFRAQEGFLGRVLGGWQFNGTYYLSSGQRFTPSQFGNLFFLGQGASYMDVNFANTFVGLDTLRPFTGNPDARRDLVGISQVDASLIFGVPVQDVNGFYSFNELNTTGNTVPVTQADVRYIFNGPGAAQIFGTPFGTASRNAEVGPRLNNLNLGFFKNIRITEAVRLQFRGELFNALNHPNPGVGFIVNDVTPDIFVDDAGTTFNRRDEMEFSRRAIQFGLKLIF
jgi:outer membrane receptor protein involved in Fe transport